MTWFDLSSEENWFEKDDAGRILYVPGGTANPFARRAFVVPDRPTVERIITAQKRIDAALLVLFFAFMACWGALNVWPPAGIDGIELVYTFVAACVLFVVLPIATAWRVATRLGLQKSEARRSFSTASAQLTRQLLRQLGPQWVLWAVGAGGVAMIAGGVWISRFENADSRLVSFFLFMALPSAALVPIIWAARKAARLAKENIRLEAVVAARTAELLELNRTLEARVREQVQHIERLGQLKHFFAAPVAEMILNDKGFDPAKVHRRELTAVSMDLRGFTAFSETSEPEEVISVLRVYHAELGILVNRCQATLEHFAGDGVMVFLNDPVEVEDHPMRALELAVELRAAMRPHLEEWRSHGFDLGLGVGIATGYATIGAVGYEGRWEYAAIGTVCNLAARLCAEAKDGQIVVSKRFLSRLGDRAECESLGERPLKGLTRPVAAFNVLELRPSSSPGRMEPKVVA